MCEPLPQEASKLPEVKDLDLESEWVFSTALQQFHEIQWLDLLNTPLNFLKLKQVKDKGYLV